MTGNVVLLGFAAAGVSGLSIIRALLSLAAFLIGAALGGKLGTMVASGRRCRLIIVAGTFEAFLIFAAALASIGFDLADKYMCEDAIESFDDDWEGDGTTH